MPDLPPDPWPENAFWEFSCAFYERPGVARTCLDLQDSAGANVNIILYGAWLAEHHGRRLTEDALLRLDAATNDWTRTVLMPLRQARTAVKNMLADLPPQSSEAALTTRVRQEILHSELCAERHQQQTLFALTAALVPLCISAAGESPALPKSRLFRESLRLYAVLLRRRAPTSAIPAAAIDSLCQALDGATA